MISNLSLSQLINNKENLFKLRRKIQTRIINRRLSDTSDDTRLEDIRLLCNKYRFYDDCINRYKKELYLRKCVSVSKYLSPQDLVENAILKVLRQASTTCV